MAWKMTYDMALEGVGSVWEAHGQICAEALMYEDSVVSARYAGLAPGNLWPMLEVVFKNIECAKAYTCVYLGGADDDEIDEFVYYGEECNV